MPNLSVNIDHVATVRQARKTFEPDPVAAATLVELAGADGIIVHLREDRRHINDRDVRLLRKVVNSKLNLEMAATEEMVSIALDVRPELVSLVPEKREELTTEGGLDVVGQIDRLTDVARRLKQGGIEVSLFIDPDFKQIEASKRIGADAVEIHTGTYADASPEEVDRCFDDIVVSANQAHDLGLRVAAGHGLTYQNIKRFRGVSVIGEYSIGHSIISRAVLVGMERAVRDMIALIKG